MLSHKVLEFGDDGYKLPSKARAPRSLRKRRIYDYNLHKMGAIDLLATVAGSLPCDDDSLSVQNTVNKECPDEDKNPNQKSMSPNTHLLLGDKVKNEVKGSSQVRNFGQDLIPDVVVSIGSNCSTEVGEGGNNGPHGSSDDENLYGYVRPCMTRHVPRIGDRRIRKILASKHWKGDAKPWYCSKRSYYLHHHQRKYPIKKRKYFDSSLQAKTHKGSRTMSSRNDHHVRLRIKSFRVPELFVEIPETASVGSLKRMVMEAVTTILGDGLRVGLMVQGKKVRDDSKTLLQTGISEENTHLDSLGFSLEPSLETTHQPLLSSYVLDSEPSLADDSRTLVPVLAPHEFKRSEQQQAAQRRVRRPFSVTEVDALVQAVEKLGTGRWRDVKVCAFEDADHRTYVDLKDKWKTLVHTARISPQQRRGEAVPQVLLDRVLKAHAYWSQQHQMHQLTNESPRFQAEALV